MWVIEPIASSFLPFHAPMQIKICKWLGFRIDESEFPSPTYLQRLPRSYSNVEGGWERG